MAKAVGIDLGTSNSSIGIKELETRLLKSTEGDFIVPSCVAFNGKTEILVGLKAKNQLKTNQANTISHVKRLMGKSLTDKEVQDIILNKKYPFSIAQHTNGALNTIAIHIPPTSKKEVQREFTPEEISSYILKKLKNDAEIELGETVTHAVLTVPAYYNDRQKNATLNAAKLANIEVLRLLSEPTAAAIAFGLDDQKGQLAETIMVFDFGGGTLDLSILTIGGDNIIEQAKGGDMWLGGVDLDRLTAELILNKAGIPASSVQYQNILNNLLPYAEGAKVRLSSEKQITIQIVDLCEDHDGFPVNIDTEITQDEFSFLARPLLEKIKPLVLNLLQGINFCPSDINKVLLVGGSSNIPLVKTLLSEVFNDEKIILHERPMLAIAEGASILAHKLMGKTEPLSEIIYTTAHEYYLRDSDGTDHLLIGKNSPLPANETLLVALKLGTQQQLVHFPFVNKVGQDLERIGDLWLSFDLENESDLNINTKREGEKIAINLNVEIDENNLLHVEANLRDYPAIMIKKNLSRGMIDEALFQQLESNLDEVSKIPNVYVGMDYEKRVLEIVSNINRIIDPQSNLINQEIESLAKHQLDLAIQFARNQEPVYTNYWFMNDGIKDYQYDNFNSNAEVPYEIKQFKEALKSFEKMLQRDSYEAILQRRDELFIEFERIIPSGTTVVISSHDLIEWANATGRIDLLEKINLLMIEKDNASNEKLKTKIHQQVLETVKMLEEIYTKTSYKIETGFSVGDQA